MSESTVSPLPAERRQRIAVITADVLTERMAGPAIRAWHIASVLSSEQEVELVTTTLLCDVSSEDFRVRSVTGRELLKLETWADVLVIQGFVLEDHPFLLATSKVLVVDLYDPLHLEQLELYRGEADAVRRDTVRHATTVINNQLRRGDFFLCATGKQRDFWLGQMAAVGRLNPLTYDEDETLQSLIAVVPFGLSEDLPQHTRPVLRGMVPGIEDADEVILWGGGIYNWFDPLTLVHAIEKLRHRRPNVRLFFMGMRHPNPDVPQMQMATAARRLADELGLTGKHVFFNEDWVAYEDRQNYLLEADVGVSTHLNHLETAFSFRTRILDYIWSALPIVATKGDAFADLIDSAQLGFTVPGGDVAALEAALFGVLADSELAAACRKNHEDVRPGFIWTSVLQPLAKFCRSPRRAPDLVDREMAAVLHGMLSNRAPMLWPLRRDLGIVRAHLRSGGVPLVLAKVRSRLGHMLPARGRG